MSDQGVPMEPGMDPAVMQPPEAPGPPEAPVPAAPEEGPQAELVRAIEYAARASQVAQGPKVAEDVWHYGQGAFYFAQALKLLVAPADPAAAQGEARAASPGSPLE